MERDKIIIDDPKILEFFHHNDSLDKNDFIASLIENYKIVKSDSIRGTETDIWDTDKDILNVQNTNIMNEISNDMNTNIKYKSNIDTNVYINMDDIRDMDIRGTDTDIPYIQNTNIINTKLSIFLEKNKNLLVNADKDGYENIKINMDDLKVVSTDFEGEKEVEITVLQEVEEMILQEVGKEDQVEEKDGKREIVIDESNIDKDYAHLNNFDMNMKGVDFKEIPTSTNNLAHNSAQNLVDNSVHNSDLNLPHNLADNSNFISPSISNNISTTQAISMNRYQYFIYNNSITPLSYTRVSTEEVHTLPRFRGEVLPIISTSDSSNYDDNNTVSTEESYALISPLSLLSIEPDVARTVPTTGIIRVLCYMNMLSLIISHRGIVVDHGINVNQHSKQRNMYTVFALVP
jgi:hypothetical protein